MKYYISKPDSYKIDQSLIRGIKKLDTEAEFVANLNDADICVFQKGWTRSTICIADHHLAKENKVVRREAYIYTDKYSVGLN